MPCIRSTWTVRDYRNRGFYAENNQRRLGEGGHPAKR